MNGDKDFLTEERACRVPQQERHCPLQETEEDALVHLSEVTDTGGGETGTLGRPLEDFSLWPKPTGSH